MTTCPQCGRTVKSTANFCGYCGTALRPSPPAPAAPSTPKPPTSEATAAPPMASRDPWGNQPPDVTYQPSPPLSYGSIDPLQPSPPATSAPDASPKTRLLGLSALLAVAGLVLIFVVAPEYTEFQRLIFNYGVRQYDPEYWMAMVGGGVCLLLSGAFLLKALSLAPAQR